MGCAQSKVDNEESVSRCKERKILMKEAVVARNAFAAGHSGYSISLKNTGAALSDYAHGEVEEYGFHQQLPPLDPTSQPPPPPPHSIENLPPPPPPLPNFSPSPIQRAMSMPEMGVKQGRKGNGNDSVAIAEEEEEGEDFGGLEHRRKNNEKSLPGPHNGKVGPGVEEEEARRESPPRTPENHGIPPPMPDAKNMAWDYFFRMDNMGMSSLGSENDVVNRNEGNFGNVENVGGVGFGGVENLRGESEIDGVEPKTPEKVAGVGIVEEEEEEEEGKKGKQIEHSKTAPAEFRMVGKKVGSVSSVNLMQVLNQIDDHFLKASESAQEVCKMLEATRLHYHSNFADNRGIIW